DARNSAPAGEATRADSGPRIAARGRPPVSVRSRKTDLPSHLGHHMTASAEPADEEVAGGASELTGGIDDLLVSCDRAALRLSRALIGDTRFARYEHAAIGRVLEEAAVAHEAGQTGARTGRSAVRPEVRRSAQPLISV